MSPSSSPTAKQAAAEPQWNDRVLFSGKRISKHMYKVLAYLRACEQNEWPWQSLDQFRTITINTLIKRDWITEWSDIDGAKYMITGSGRTALQLAGMPVDSRTHDGICPLCRKRPKYVLNGRKQGYCHECDKERRRKHQKIFGTRKSPHRTCPRCKKRKVHVWASGKASTYCLQCKRERHRDYKRRQKEQRRQQIADGTPPICIKCKTRPVHHTENSVYDYCQPCLRDYMNAYNHKRRHKEVE